MVEKAKKFKFGWFGDQGHGERMIQKILAGKKTATSSLAYETEDADLKVGDKLELVDKKGRLYATIVIVDIQIRKFGTFDEMLAAHCGHTLEELRELMAFANSRMPSPDEDMRVTFFKLVQLNRPPRI
jgi:uncharacterized protein YhfF